MFRYSRSLTKGKMVTFFSLISLKHLTVIPHLKKIIQKP